MEAIHVRDLNKEFVFNEGKIFKKKNKKVQALKNISLDVNKGETIALIGPNGAGKSTMIKILTGILNPTNGIATVCGLCPWEKRKELAFKIGTVFGQRSQLSFHLSAKDSFVLYEKIYEIEHDVFQNRLNRLVKLFEIEDFIDQPVRKLSLGQRMRCEIISSLLHNPEIIFLDEPTIGLDVVAKRNLRDILRNLNKEFNTTIFLTSHDTGDIEALCERTVIINEGEIVIDQKTLDLKQTYIKKKKLYVRFSKPTEFKNGDGVNVLDKNEFDVTLEMDLEKVNFKEFLEKIVSTYDIADINIEDPSLEEVITSIYEKK